MRLTVRYFAAIREAVGVGSEQVDTTATSLGALRDELISRGAPYADVLARTRLVRMARDQALCDESAILDGAAEVAFFPPVTGG